MNIGIDAKRIFFNNSGLGNYGRRFYLALAKGFPGDSFFLYTPRPVPANNPYLSILRNNSQTIFPRHSFHKILGGALWRSALINGQLIKDNIGVYYGLSNEIPFGIRGLKLAKVVIIHDLIFLRYPELYPAIDVYFYKRKTLYSCKYADCIIAASEQTKNDIINFYGINPEKISVLYPCTDPLFYAKEVEDSTAFFQPARKYVISVGAITPRKNLMKTIEAFETVKDKYDLDLVVIGTAVGLGRKYLEKIMDFNAKHKLTGRVHFLGNVPYQFVPDICRKAQLMVYPSQFEGFGMPIVEGLFSKIPVITSAGGCFPEAGGDAAIYINPEVPAEIAAQISNVMDSAKLRDEIVTRGILYAEKFSQSTIEKDILAFHQSIIPS